jgi:DNA-binding response OmpR family regulator
VKRILVVDDDTEIVGLLKEYLQTRSTADQYVVETAADGLEGLNAVSRARPDLVILDIDRPGLNAMEVLRKIRSRDATIPVVMLTGSTDVSVAGQTLKDGAVCYAPKPLDFKYLDHFLALSLRGPGRSRPR